MPEIQPVKQKKIAFIVNIYSESLFVGGGEKVNFFIIKELLKRGYSIDIYASKSKVAESSLVNIIIKDKDFYSNYNKILEKYDRVISVNMEFPAEITYSHSHSYMFNKNIFKLIFEMFFKKSFIKRFKRHIRAAKNAKNINKIVISSNIVKDDYIKNYKISSEKIYLLPPGVEYREKQNRIPNKENFVFGLVAKSAIKKGLFLTLHAINFLKKKNYDFKVRIINEEHDKYLACKLWLNFLVKFYNLEKYIEFLPLQKDMTSFYNSVNCLLVPSLKEPFGLVTTEAMSYSLPVVVSSITGSADLIIDEKNGFIIDFSGRNKSKKLADKMEKILNLEQSEYKELSENAYNTVVNMTYERFAEKFVDIMEK